MKDFLIELYIKIFGTDLVTSCPFMTSYLMNVMKLMPQYSEITDDLYLIAYQALLRKEQLGCELFIIL